MKLPVYLDYNSTTPVDPRVLETMLPYFTNNFGNAASRTHSYGWIAEEAVKEARAQVASLIDCEEQELIFTSGATEGINLAIKGVFEAYRTKGSHFITVETEHKAVLDTFKSLEKKGAEVTYLEVNREGLIDLEDLKRNLRPDTVMVSIMYANNETGVIQPIKQIADLVHENKSIFMSDATQAVGKVRVDVNEDGIDLLCLSGHKFYGPKGAGALFVRRKNPRVTLFPQLEGGGHERGLRSGTLNVPGIVGLGKASELAQQELWNDAKKTSTLRTKLEQSLLDLGNVNVNGSQKSRLPNTTSLSIRGIKADQLISKLKDLAFSAGSACTSAVIEPSHVLKAMGLTDEEAYSSVRFSLGRFTTKEEVDFAVEKLVEVINQ